MSPIPNNLPTNLVGLNSSRSSILSPFPIKKIFAPVTADAANAPPPFAVPSSLCYNDTSHRNRIME